MEKIGRWMNRHDGVALLLIGIFMICWIVPSVVIMTGAVLLDIFKVGYGKRGTMKTLIAVLMLLAVGAVGN